MTARWEWRFDWNDPERRKPYEEQLTEYDKFIIRLYNRMMNTFIAKFNLTSLLGDDLMDFPLYIRTDILEKMNMIYCMEKAIQADEVKRARSKT